MPDANDILSRVARVMDSAFRVPASYAITRETTSADVDGWDSLSHTLFLMALEQEFGLEFPVDKVYDLADVGALVDVIVDAATRRG